MGYYITYSLNVRELNENDGLYHQIKSEICSLCGTENIFEDDFKSPSPNDNDAVEIVSKKFPELTIEILAKGEDYHCWLDVFRNGELIDSKSGYRSYIIEWDK